MRQTHNVQPLFLLTNAITDGFDLLQIAKVAFDEFNVCRA
jgi:hypothetical protein